MKKLICMILALLLLSGCAGNFGDTELKDSMAIPENGIIEKELIQQIKDENAVAVFHGESNGLRYEWKLFGKDIKEAKDVNLQVDLLFGGEELTATFAQEETLGFAAMLSIHLSSKWSYLTASAYQNSSKVYAVSLTGTKEASILNIFVKDTLGTLSIRPDPKKDPTLIDPQPSTPPAPTAPSVPATQPSTQPSIPTTAPTTQPSTQPSIPATTPTTRPSTAPTIPSIAPTTQATIPSTEPTKDQYLTDPVPSGMPNPVEPGDAVIDKDTVYTCTFSIECSTILNNLENLKPEKLEILPSDGVILAEIEVQFYAGESVFDVLQRVCKEKKIHMESSWTPMYNSAYIEGIANFYEFDCGDLSGWMYRVNGWYPNYGCSRYQLEDGDVVEWRYTCDLGRDVGDNYLAGA